MADTYRGWTITQVWITKVGTPRYGDWTAESEDREALIGGATREELVKEIDEIEDEATALEALEEARAAGAGPGEIRHLERQLEGEWDRAGNRAPSPFGD